MEKHCDTINNSEKDIVNGLKAGILKATRKNNYVIYVMPIKLPFSVTPDGS